MKNNNFFDNMVRCDKCGKWSKKSYVNTYGACLCGNVLDNRARFKYKLFIKLKLWRYKNYKKDQIERNKYD